MSASAPGPRTSLPLLVTGLVTEATRQLGICNACRYCEGLCAVFPALERRSVLDAGDVSQLANLCHDCRACFDACMYSPPHEFALDLPRALSAVRLADYQRHVWPRRVPRALSGWSGVVLGSLLSAVLVLILALAHAGWRGLIQADGRAASPYQLVPYPVLASLMAAAALYAAVVMGLAARSHWRSAESPLTGRVTVRALARAAWQAATLRYLRGGGVECYYPEDDQPSAGRRRLHSMVAYGFGLCLVATVAAAVEQDLVGVAPPYPWLSVPVLAGTAGGIGMVIGCAGLLGLK
ncbi:MAG: tricarballylate utilization 4Fe-4S protein TcuB, partial [Trebonia sp.]